ncbi:MAG TPA: hypothetical protein VK641_09810, partial [Terriglobales bacterium]|nr:hypothetical protein [Terriglobales bacterium]
MKNVLVAVLLSWLCLVSHAQVPAQLDAGQSLPSAPLPQPPPGQVPATLPSTPQPFDPPPPVEGQTSLSLKQAEALALKNNPQISLARLTALASQQVT